MVSAFFRLTIGERRAGVEIIDILFDEQGLDEGAKADRLSEALKSARLAPGDREPPRLAWSRPH